MHQFHENEFYRYYEVVIMETYHIYIQTDTRTQHTVMSHILCSMWRNEKKITGILSVQLLDYIFVSQLTHNPLVYTNFYNTPSSLFCAFFFIFSACFCLQAVTEYNH